MATLHEIYARCVTPSGKAMFGAWMERHFDRKEEDSTPGWPELVALAHLVIEHAPDLAPAVDAGTMCLIEALTRKACKRCADKSKTSYDEDGYPSWFTAQREDGLYVLLDGCAGGPFTNQDDADKWVRSNPRDETFRHDSNSDAYKRFMQ
jgi:hypothetical protein